MAAGTSRTASSLPSLVAGRGERAEVVGDVLVPEPLGAAFQVAHAGTGAGHLPRADVVVADLGELVGTVLPEALQDDVDGLALVSGEIGQVTLDVAVAEDVAASVARVQDWGDRPVGPGFERFGEERLVVPGQVVAVG